MENKEEKCPKCGADHGQHKKGFTTSGSQRMYCNHCGCKYTPNPKTREYSDEVRKQALRLLALGNTGRGVGKALNMSKANAYRWAREEAKKQNEVWISPETDTETFELDEIFWFTNGRKTHESGINVYIMTMISRVPRQIVAFEVEESVSAESIQKIVDRSPRAKTYCTDGGGAYLDVSFWGEHRRNIRDKSDTHNIESTNSDIRHYIAGLRRKSRCFFRKLETMKAVLTLFISAYNKFGEAKRAYRERHPDFGRDYPFNHLQFI